MFDKVEISLDPEYAGGKEVLVIENNAEGYATGVTAGGRPLKGFRISHSELTGAGTLTFE